MPNTLFDRFFVPEIELHEDHSSEITGDFKVSFHHFFTVRNDNGVSGAGEAVHDVSAKETCCAEDGCGVSYKVSTPSYILVPKYIPPKDDRPPDMLIIGLPVLVI
jgi:hypothetical protein